MFNRRKNKDMLSSVREHEFTSKNDGFNTVGTNMRQGNGFEPLGIKISLIFLLKTNHDNK
jgi:hypothetical protein